MKPLAPSEVALIGHSLYMLMGKAYKEGQISIMVTSKLTLHFSPEQIRQVIEKLDIYET